VPARPPGAVPTRTPALVSLLCALAASVALLWLPLYQGLSVRTQTGAAWQRGAERRATLREVNGPAVYGLLAAPVGLAAIPLVLRRYRVWRRAVQATAVLLIAFVLLTGFSVGFFYAPSALAMAVAALKELRRRPAAA
jgi:hypothetical protein